MLASEWFTHVSICPVALAYGDHSQRRTAGRKVSIMAPLYNVCVVRPGIIAPPATIDVSGKQTAP